MMMSRSSVLNRSQEYLGDVPGVVREWDMYHMHGRAFLCGKLEASSMYLIIECVLV